jgi:DNA-binding GntR family transcriptional regulator
LKHELKIATTVHERTYSELKRMIVDGSLPPGTTLQLRPLASKLGVSKTPVIEAIRRLERDGLISVVARLGATVKQWSREEIYEAYHIRRSLEGEAARLFVTRATVDDKDKLVRLNEKFDRLAASPSADSAEADVNLHLHIVRCCRYPRLCQLVEDSKIENILQYSFQGMLSKNELHYKQYVGVHEHLVRALLRNSPDDAENEMKRHLELLLSMIKLLEDSDESEQLLGVAK